MRKQVGRWLRMQRVFLCPQCAKVYPRTLLWWEVCTGTEDYPHPERMMKRTRVAKGEFDESQERELRRDVAEQVCWKVLVLMGVGELEEVPMNLRPLLAEPMQEWADLAMPSTKERRGV